MDLDQLRTFLAVLDHGSFSRAAETLHVGQSTVSFHVKALETAVSARLIDRRGGSVRPTAAGIVLKRYAVRIVALREEALAKLAAEEGGEAGHLAVAASTIPGEYLLAPVLARFVAVHPRVAVTVEIGDSREALDRLVAHEADLALVGARRPDKRITYAPFAADEIVLVARPEAGAARARSVARRLRGARLLVREKGSGTRDAAAAFVARHASDGEAPPLLQLGSTEALRRAALEGLGLALISDRAVAEDLRAGRLVRVPAAGLPIRRIFHAARLRSATPSAAARQLLKALMQHFR